MGHHNSGGVHGGRWHVAPGYYPAWILDEAYPGPDWVVDAEEPIEWPQFEWLNGVAPGEWQCTAFNHNDQTLEPYSDIGKTRNQAAYDALYACGGKEWKAEGCYIPAGFCKQKE
jgi:hypothetical protein